MVKAEGDEITSIPIKREEGIREAETGAYDAEDAGTLHIGGGDGSLGEVRLEELGLSPTGKLPKKEEDAGRGVDMSIPPWNPPEGREQEDAKPEEESTNDFLLIKGEDGFAREMRSEEQSLTDQSRADQIGSLWHEHLHHTLSTCTHTSRHRQFRCTRRLQASCCCYCSQPSPPQS